MIETAANRLTAGNETEVVALALRYSRSGTRVLELFCLSSETYRTRKRA